VKHCYKCGKDKVLSEFPKHKGHSDGLASECKSCNSIRVKAWVASLPKERLIKHKSYHNKYSQEHPASWESKRDTRFRTNYGRSLAEYNALLEKQDFRCAICRKHVSEFSKALHNDHNHVTGKLRGLLCHKCNLRLGHLEDKAFLAVAIEYLAAYNETLPLVEYNSFTKTRLG